MGRSTGRGEDLGSIDALAAALPPYALCSLSGPGATSLGLALGAVRMGTGPVAAIGLAHLGYEAAAELGLSLERLAVCSDPGVAWPELTALALEACALVLLAPTSAIKEQTARRLGARVRERRSLLLVLESRAGARRRWPVSPDVRLEVTEASWLGPAGGAGRLETRELTVQVGGHRALAPGTYEIVLPNRAGRPEVRGTRRQRPSGALVVARAG